MSRSTILILAGCFFASSVAAQTASKTWFAPVTQHAPGGGCQSTTYYLNAAVGAGAVAQPSGSATYRLAGGFTANLGVVSSGKPWLAGVTPRFATMRGKAALTLSGTEFDLGSTPTIKIGGQVAVVGTRVKHAITTLLPIQPAPGWQPVEVISSAGTTILPRGIGVLPMVMSDPAPASDVAFDLVFKGTKGDFVYWAVGAAQVAPIPIPGILYGLGLHPSAFVVVAGFSIADNSGEARLPIPPRSYGTGTIYIQGLFSTTNPGYAPASFSNVLRL